MSIRRGIRWRAHPLLPQWVEDGKPQIPEYPILPACLPSIYRTLQLADTCLPGILIPGWKSG